MLFFLFYTFKLKFIYIGLAQPFSKVDLGGGLNLGGLGEVRAHVLLEVEVSKLVGLLKLKKASKLGVGVDLATIGLVLEIMVANVHIDLTGNLSASHLGTSGLLKEGSELVTNAGGLHEAGRGAVASLALTLGALLLGRLKLASPLLLKSAVLRLKGGQKSTELLKLSEELNRLLSDRGNIAINTIDGNINVNGSRLNRSGSDRGGLLLRGLGLLGLNSLLNNRGCGSSGFNNGSGSGLRLSSSFGSSCHLYTTKETTF